MKKSIKIIIAGIIYCVVVYFTTSCKHESISPSPMISVIDTTDYGTDSLLYILAINKTGFKWYYGKDTLLSRSKGSGHPQPFFKTRFNKIASANLDAKGRLIPNSVFKEGSMIVKEVFSADTNIAKYAILYKQAKSKNADAKGWVWGYINIDGSVSIEASKKGMSCISCHSQTENIDYVLMNKYF